MARKKKVKIGKFGIAKFLVVTLLLGGGLFYGIRLSQQNQDGRSSAASSIAGSCYHYSVFLPNKKVYVTNGSTVCNGGGGLISNGWIYICVNGTKVKSKSCNGGDNSGCMETKGTLVSDINGKAYYKYSAKCRNDLACTNSGGTCNVEISGGPAVGESCTTTSGKNGVVKADLCLSKANMSTKRCCMPISTSTYYFYNPSTKSCESTDAYTSLTKCKDAKNKACFTNLNSCRSSYSKCTSGGGSCILVSNSCSGGTWKSNLCPGDSSIKCCVK